MRSARARISCVTLVLVFFTAGAFELASPQGPTTGYAVKKPVYGGGGATAGWGAIGTVVKEVMKPYGWDIQLCRTCAGAARAARNVAGAVMPPPPGRGSTEGPQPNGPIDFGATGAQF